MIILSDVEKLLLVFGVSVLFTLIILVIFHYFRKCRKDKLLCEKYNDEYELSEEMEAIQEVTRNSLPGSYERYKIEERTSQARQEPINKNSSAEFNINQMKRDAKDYSFLGWMKFVWKTTDMQIYCLCNAEGLMYLYFLRTTANLFLLFSLISTFILLPLFVVNNEANEAKEFAKNHNITLIYKNQTITNLTNSINVNQIASQILHRITVKTSFDSAGALFLVLIFSILFTLLTFYHIYSFSVKLNMINQFNKAEDSLDSDVGQHTIHIRGLNRTLTALEAQKMLTMFLTSKYSEIMEVQVIPKYERLMDLLNQKLYVETKYNQYKELNATKAKREIIRIGELYCINSVFVDAETYFENMKRITDKMIDFYRKLNMDCNTGNAFVSFKTPQHAQKVLENEEEIFALKDTFHGSILNIGGWRLAKAAPPSDLIWDNLKFTRNFRILRTVIFTFVLFYLCLYVITPLKIAEEINPLIGEITIKIPNSFMKKIIEDYYPSLIVVIMNTGILPFAVSWIATFERHYKRSYREKSIFVKSFVFMVINTFVIPTFGGFSLIGIFEFFVDNKIYQWNYNLIDPLIDNAFFFSRYMIQVTFLSNSFQLLAFPQYFVRKFRVFLATTKYEKFNALLIKRFFDYGFHYSFAITVFIMTLVFSTTIPLITPFGCLFFYFKYFIDKYNLMCVYPVEFESQGTIGEFVIKFALLGIVFFQVIITGLFLKINYEYSFYLTIFYLIFITTMYFVTRRYIFVKKENKIAFIDGNDSVFQTIEKRQRVSVKGKNSWGSKLDIISIEEREEQKAYRDKLYHLMKVAYIHPTERELISNPNLVYYDSYSYFKASKKYQDNKTEKIEYSSIIKRSEKNIRGSNPSIIQTGLKEFDNLKELGVNELKEGLMEDFF